jgi:hypothetical protein
MKMHIDDHYSYQKDSYYHLQEYIVNEMHVHLFLLDEEDFLFVEKRFLKLNPSYHRNKKTK